MATETDLPGGATDPLAASDRQPRLRLLAALREATLGQFEVYQEIGRGGMGTVFLGYDIALGRHVAIKVISPSLLLDEGMAERFRREARIAASLEHPHIIPVYAVRETEQLAFFVMKYVDGCTLDFVIREHSPLPPELARMLVLQIGAGLGYAHRRGVVHRDIKPANILIDQEGNAVITDFGIARDNALPSVTATGDSVGTPYYMSPEQCSKGQVSGQSDQYSLGVLAYQMLSGTLPFVGANSADVMRAHVMEQAKSLTALCPECPPELAEVVMRMLSKRPEERWPGLDDALGLLRSRAAMEDHPARSQLVAMAQSSPRRPVIPTAPSSPIPVSGVPVGKRNSVRRRVVLAVTLSVTIAAVALIITYKRKTEAAVGTPLNPTNLVGSDSVPAKPVILVRDTPVTIDSIPAPLVETSADKPVNTKLPSQRVIAPPTAPSTVDAVAVDSAPRPTTPWAWVLVGTRDTNAFLYLNGVPHLPKGPSLRWWRVTPGQINLSFHAEGCTPWEETRTVAAGDSVRVGYRFPTCAPPP